MYCTNCGKRVDDQTTVCPACGRELPKKNAAQASAPSVSVHTAPPVGEQAPLNVGLLVWSIINTVLGFFCSSFYIGSILGIIAIVLTVIAQNSYKGKKAPELLWAKICNIVATIVIILSLILSAVFWVLNIVLGIGLPLMGIFAGVLELVSYSLELDILFQELGEIFLDLLEGSESFLTETGMFFPL
ncbi:MAG: zinc ribbon domain-containing protein [Clostridia bacterium]|nr:zinc ribbon domain-containing protein [Clostridia bacterium]